MKKFCFPLILLSTLVLSGCSIDPANNGLLSSDSSSETSHSGSGSSSSGSGSQSSGESSSSSESSSSEEPPAVVDLGLKTIAEVKAYCNEHVTEVNSAGIGINYSYKVTIKATSISHFDLVKTTSIYGVSSPGKAIFADPTGYIACAGGDIVNSVKKYSTLGTSGYTITAYLSKYFNKPELFIGNKNDYAYDKNLSISYDFFDSAVEKNLSVASLYSKFKDMPYNCGGNGYDEVYSVSNIKIIQKSDNSQYLGTDGYRMLKVISRNTISVGSIYNFAGLITTADWQPAINVYAKTVVSDESIINNFPTDYLTATPLTITNCKKITRPLDNDYNRHDDFILSFQYMYKATVYASYWSKTDDRKHYITISDSKCPTSNEINEADAHNRYGMVDLENTSCWNLDDDEIYSSCLGRHVEAENPVELYYVLWQQRKVDKKAAWKVFIIEDLIPEVPGE